MLIPEQTVDKRTNSKDLPEAPQKRDIGQPSLNTLNTRPTIRIVQGTTLSQEIGSGSAPK